jgi:hypothetical protein
LTSIQAPFSVPPYLAFSPTQIPSPRTTTQNLSPKLFSLNANEQHLSSSSREEKRTFAWKRK